MKIETQYGKFNSITNAVKAKLRHKRALFEMQEALNDRAEQEELKKKGIEVDLPDPLVMTDDDYDVYRGNLSNSPKIIVRDKVEALERLGLDIKQACALISKDEKNLLVKMDFRETIEHYGNFSQENTQAFEKKMDDILINYKKKQREAGEQIVKDYLDQHQVISNEDVDMVDQIYHRIVKDMGKIEKFKYNRKMKKREKLFEQELKEWEDAVQEYGDLVELPVYIGAAHISQLRDALNVDNSTLLKVIKANKETFLQSKIIRWQAIEKWAEIRNEYYSENNKENPDPEFNIIGVNNCYEAMRILELPSWGAVEELQVEQYDSNRELDDQLNEEETKIAREMWALQKQQVKGQDRVQDK